MKETIEYHVTLAMQKRAMQSYFWKHAMGRRWLVIPASLLFGALLHHPVFSEFHHHIGTGCLLFGGVFILVYFKSYRQHMQIATDALSIHDLTDVRVTLSEDTITIAKAGSRQQVEWTRVNKLLETSGFLILFSGKVPVGNLPKAEFSSEQLDFIMEKENG